MSLLDLARVIVYRFHEKGLEIFLVKNEMLEDPDVWKIPKGELTDVREIEDKIANGEYIDLGEFDKTKIATTYAIEGDWHDIPSIKGMLKHDVKLAKKILSEKLPESEKGAFFAVKEAFKKVLPEEYKALKELKEILLDRNAIKNI